MCVPTSRSVSDSVPAVLTGVDIRDDVMERLEQNGLVRGVGQPWVREGLRV